MGGRVGKSWLGCLEQELDGGKDTAGTKYLPLDVTQKEETVSW